jgi:hypothetical protein
MVDWVQADTTLQVAAAVVREQLEQTVLVAQAETVVLV